MTDVKTIRKQYAALKNTLERMNAFIRVSDEFGRTREYLTALTDELDRMLNEPSKVNLSAYSFAYLKVQSAMNECIANGRDDSVAGKLNRSFGNLLKAQIKEFSAVCGEELYKAFTSCDSLPKEYRSPAFEFRLREHRDTVGPIGRRPSLFGCGDVTLADYPAQTVFEILQWLGRNEIALKDSGLPPETIASHPYHTAYERIKGSVLEAPAAKQAEFARLMAVHEALVMKEAENKYQEFLRSSHRIGEYRDMDALLRLSAAPEYTASRAAEALRREFNGTVLQAMSDHCRAGVRKGGNGIAADSAHMLSVIGGDMARALSQADGGALAAQYMKTNGEERLRRAGYISGTTAGDAFELFRRTNALNDADSSASYIGMLRQIRNLADDDPVDPDRREEYMKRVRACEKASRAYLNSHRRVPYTPRGKDRVALANSIHDFCQGLMDEKDRRIADESNREINRQLEGLGGRTMKLGDIKRMAALQRGTVRTVRLNPPVPHVNEGVNPVKKAGIGHVLYSALYRVMNVPLLSEIFDRPINMLAMSRVRPADDAGRVPGVGDENFEEIRPDEMGNDQPMITDKRRIPLVWEEAIPEDPDRPATVTLEVEQGREGSAMGMDVFENNTGHTYLTLKYTKPDPVTGRPQRYTTSFGFHPKPGFTAPVHIITQYTEGLKIPGELQNDAHQRSSVGKTFEINTKQLNQIIMGAQEYEKEGYNMISRNCTTFAKDMLERAGIPVEGLFKEVDVTSVAGMVDISAGLSLLVPMGANIVSKTARIKIFAARNDTDISYNRYGRKKVVREDLERFNKRDFFFRAKGYSPGLTGEIIRNSQDFSLHARGVSDEAAGSLDKLRNAINDLQLAIDAIREYGSAENKETAENFRLYNSTAMLVQSQYLDKTTAAARVTGENGVQKTVYSAKTTGKANRDKKNIFDATAAVNQYIDDLNGIFRDSFKSDPRLNRKFQHVVAELENLRAGYKQRYGQLLETYAKSSDPLGELGDLVDGSRDCARRAMQLKYETERYDYLHGKAKVAFSPKQVAACLKMYGSIEARLTVVDEMHQKRRAGTATKEDEQKYYNIAETFDAFTDAEDNVLAKHVFTDREIEFYFYTMPKAEFKNMGTIMASENYHAIAYEGIFNGALPELKKLAAELMPDVDAVSALIRSGRCPADVMKKLPPEEQEELKLNQKKFELAQRQYKDKLGEAINNYLDEKLRDPRTAETFNKMKETYIRFNAEARQGVKLEPGAEIPKEYRIPAEMKFYESFSRAYADVLIAEIRMDAMAGKSKEKWQIYDNRSHFFNDGVLTSELGSDMFTRVREIRAEMDREDEERQAEARKAQEKKDFDAARKAVGKKTEKAADMRRSRPEHQTEKKPMGRKSVPGK